MKIKIHLTIFSLVGLSENIKESSCLHNLFLAQRWLLEMSIFCVCIEIEYDCVS